MTARRLTRILEQLAPRDAAWIAEQLDHPSQCSRRDAALRMVHAELLAGLSDRAAAYEIAAAVRSRRTIRADTAEAQATTTRRAAIRRRIEELLGSSATLPGMRRIRQVLGGKEKPWAIEIAHSDRDH